MLEVVTLKDGRRQSVQEVIPWRSSFSSDSALAGVCLEQGESPPSEAPENTCSRHLVWLHLGPPTRFENRFSGLPLRARTLGAQSLLFIPAGSPMQARWLDPIASLGLQIDPELIPAVMGEREAGGFRFPQEHADPDPFIAAVLHSMRRDFEEGLPGGEIYRESLATALVAHLVRRQRTGPAGGAVAAGGLPRHRLRRVIDYMHDRLAEDLSLRGMAALVGLNHAHFARAFKQSMGVSPYRYIVSRRVERACGLLEDPRVPLAEIAGSCGFASQSSFTATFRRVKGVTPGTYRRAWR